MVSQRPLSLLLTFQVKGGLLRNVVWDFSFFCIFMQAKTVPDFYVGWNTVKLAASLL